MSVLSAGDTACRSKEFTPGMVKAVFDELKKEQPKAIASPLASTTMSPIFLCHMTERTTSRARTWWVPSSSASGADGTVGANKNSIKIIGEETDNFAQGYYVYDSKKSGAVTISHLRFGPKPIRSAYLLRQAKFVACHQFSFLEKYDVLQYAVPGAVFLLNSPYGADEVWEHLPKEVQSAIIEKTAPLLRDRRRPGGEGSRYGEQNQHDHADLLLCHIRRPAAGGGDREDQGIDQKDLRQERRRGGEPELRCC